MEEKLILLSNNEPSWFALLVRTRKEHQVATILNSKGYEQFLPTVHCPRATSESAPPLFPGYVFCRMSAHARAPIITTPGVIRIVSFGGKPAAIDAAEIRSIRVMVNSGVPTSTSIGYQEGDLVRVEGGPLRGAVGVLTSVNKQNRLVVSIKMMMRTVAAELHPEWLRMVSPVQPRFAELRNS